MPNLNDQRYFKRIHFNVQTQVEYQDKIYTGNLLDISLKGALITFPNDIPIRKDEDCVLRIHLPSSNITLVFVAELVHLENHHYGFIFNGEDDETIAHLRRLLELNLGDEFEIEHELFFLLYPAEDD